ACRSMVISNVTTEGYPGARFHAGCKVIDEIEQLAIERAKLAFRAQYANVQPHSGTSANEIVLFSLLRPGDTLLGLELAAGGHLTHGSTASISGRYFKAIGYSLTGHGLIDYDQVRRMAHKFHPKLIICGASAYPRIIDFKRFREIADEVGAFVLADISHIAGLVVAGEHPSPIDYAHFTTTSTYKQLYGPRGGLILMGRDSEALSGKKTLGEMIQRAVFPYFQGTPDLGSIAAKARALARVVSPEFKLLAHRIVTNARCLAESLVRKGYSVLTGGTDNHLMLVDTLASGITGVIAERALEECNIIVNKNRILGDTKPAQVTSGMRLGTNSLALRNMGDYEMVQCADLIHRILSSITIYDDTRYKLEPDIKEVVLKDVRELCCRFPIPDYLVDHT
ncbi:MAG: serine hydroxymethyltransferase, partial [Ktedonobacteraceae bacterium]|nr:serine hydroxymethyltransferase [Ktedonobacteraceae bacterium]